MKPLKLFFVSSILWLLPSSAFAIKCPELPGDGDWDRDGILNSVDECCFLATLPERNLLSVCPDNDLNRKQDMNQNGWTDDREGECCIEVPNTVDDGSGTCRAADSNGCETGEISVSCDRLLFYSGIDSHATAENCGDDCVCYAVDDFDLDRISVDNQGSIFLSFLDNCPWVENPPLENLNGQGNRDGDLFGDACDVCAEDMALPKPCVMGAITDTADSCPLETPCLPFVEISEDGRMLQVNYYCAPDEEADEDGDGVGNSCDNCKSVSNPDQLDDDGDKAGNACDKCKDDPNKVDPGRCGCGLQDIDDDNDGTPNCDDLCPKDPKKSEPGLCGCHQVDSESDRDGDGYIDCLDNCPDHYNPDQLDDDEDEVGNACEETGDSDTNVDTASEVATTDSDGVDSESETVGIDTETADTEIESDLWDAGELDASVMWDAGEFDTDTETDSEDTAWWDTETTDTEIKDTEIKDTETTDTEIKDTEIKDTMSNESDPVTSDPENPDTSDRDTAGTEPDDDGDGIPNSADNCPFTANPDQNEGACTEDIFKGGACDCHTATGGSIGVFDVVLSLLSMVR